MPFDPETSNELKPWLVRTLEPICDAEPGALADYILALLKHNAPESELRKELAGQLEEFLEKEGPPFIDTLFTALRTKSYLPYSATTPSSGYASSSAQSIDTGIPIPLDALLSPSIPTSPSRGRKRSIDHDDRDSRPPAKGPRLSEGQFSRYGRNDARPAWGARPERTGRMNFSGRADYMDGGLNGVNGGMDAGMAGGMNGAGHMNGRPGHTYHPPDRRGICRDYHNNGYCARGAFCKFSHGEDAVIPSQLFPMNGNMGVGPMPFMPMLPNSGMPYGAGGGSNAAYDPHERMDMRPPVPGPGANIGSRPLNQRAPMIPRQGEFNGQKPGELPVIQDLTPPGTRDDRVAPNGSQNGYSDPNGSTMAGPSSGGDVVMNGTNGTNGHMNASPDVDVFAPPISPRGRGMRGGRGGGGRGTFGGDVHSFRPEKRSDKTLVVEKIPEDKLSLGAVNEWFKRFGTVTNVAVDAVHAKALVSFSNHEEALAAWKAEDAVFGNRFVKVFWHRPLEGHGQMGARMLAASAPLVANISTKESVPAAPQADSPTPVAPVATPSRKPSTSSAASALAAKQKLLEQQIAEQKSLMSLLATASAQEKKDIMARLRKLGEEMKPSAVKAQSPPPVSSSSPAPAATTTKPPRGITPRSEDKERLERERLDRELELHHAVGAVEGETEESTEDLKERLAKLKAEAASLGLSEVSDVPYGSGAPYRSFRGRGRGARGGYYRGAMRGGPPRATSTDAVQAVRDWYETTGQVDSVEPADNGDIIVSFRTRAAAEQVWPREGGEYITVGPVQISWVTGQPTGALQKAPSVAPDSTYATEDKSMVDERPGSPVEIQEETAAGGWGGDDGDDAFGML
ncbi:hypothetical protein B0H21DRAFT_723637 [Amylocystis lapponica]|nr:hypothetical protein B0H21DRAFT_723637 [Amylocystis lapponica]